MNNRLAANEQSAPGRQRDDRAGLGWNHVRYLGARPLVGEEALRFGQGGAGPSGNCLLLSLESGVWIVGQSQSGLPDATCV